MNKKRDWRARDPQSENERKRYQHPIPSRVLILEALKGLGTPVTLEELSSDLGLTQERDIKALRNRLRAMERDGQILRNRRREYCLIGEIPVLAGTVSAHRDGYGFVSLDEGGDDVYLGPREMAQLFHRDRVAVRITGHDRRGRPEGRVVDVIGRAASEMAGRYVREAGVGFVIPENPRNTHQIVIPAGEEGNAKPGRMVAVELLEPPTRHSPPIGRVVEVLGDITAPGMETEVAIRSHGLPHRFNRKAISEAEAYGDKIPEAARKGRVDLRDKPLVTIDGADAKDFDDAVFAEPAGRNMRLYVAIADVAHYVRPGTVLDDDAQDRGTSVYFPTRVIPMLPEALSNGLCSLNPEVDRLCMVCEMTVTPAGNVKDEKFYEAVMRSHARFTYHDMYALMWEGDKKLHKRHASLTPHLRSLVKVYRSLLRARGKRGAVELDIPASRFEFRKDGHPTGVVRYTRNDAHRLIEECMIAANVAAARFLKAHKIPALFRNHEEPEEERVERLRSFLGAVGIALPQGGRIRPTQFRDVAVKVSDRPDASVLSFMLLRTMSQAEYGPNCEGHFGLALKEYAHFTSPIRRYPDLLVHRAIKHIIEKGNARRYTYKPPDMEALGKHCSMTERRAEEAVRDVESWLKCEVMLDHVGDEFEGVVVAVTEFGLFVEIQDMNIEGLVHVTSLGHDYFRMDRAGHRLVGRSTGQSYALGQTLRVKVAGVSIEDRKIDFDLARKKNKQPSRGRKKQRGGRRGG